jgi:CDP-diacylglycerol--serine O-phosphatidyltransferase
MTLGNLICGFAAIHFALRAMYDFGAGVSFEQFASVPLRYKVFERMLPSFLSVGAFLILIGMVLDAFDGLIARVTRSTTTFGGQLDSLADVVTFGAAPATLMVAFMTKELAGDSIVPSPISEHALGRLTWVAAAIYVAFTAIRLARFNVEHAEADFDHRIFRGLPCPGAASILVALIVFQDQQIFPMARTLLVYATPAIAAAVALLMVSRIPYKRFHRAYLLGRQPFGQVLLILLVFAAFWSYKAAPTLLVVTLWYGLSGPIFAVSRMLRDRRLATTTAAPSLAKGGLGGVRSPADSGSPASEKNRAV